MQKHDVWLSNRGYLRHIEVLKKIQTRRAETNSNRPLPHLPEPSPPQDHKTNEEGSQQFTRSKDSLNVREQKILWDNYYLGKRIIETPPVISKRRLDEEYVRHKKLVKCLTTTTRRVPTSDFRVKKLQEYKQNMEQASEERAIENVHFRRFIRVQIQYLAFYRQRPNLDQLCLVFSHTGREGKVFKQSLNSFPCDQLLNRHFYFAISKNMIKKEEAVSIQLQNMKGLTQLSVGYFSFPCVAQLRGYRAQLFHCGKGIGEVQISTCCGQRQC